MNIAHIRLIAACTFAALALPVIGKEEPLWEAGLGASGLSFPYYRGSDERRDFLFPVPYFVYRGEVFRADRNGVRGELIDSKRFELSITAGASLPVGNDDVEARRGMEDLKPTVGLGPSAKFLLAETADQRYQLRFELPFLASMTVEHDPQFVGWQVSPRLNLDIESPYGMDGWRFGVLAGPIYATRQQHEYFYSVDPSEATATRPAYQAAGGYAGMQFLVSVSKRFPRFWFGGFVRQDTLKDAVFSDSPLVKSKDYLAAGFGIAWVIGESERRVTVFD